MPVFAQSFGLGNVARKAEVLAKQAYQPAQTDLPRELRKPLLSYDHYRDIRFNPEKALWRGQGSFEAMFFHLGLYQTEAVLINEITPAGVRHLAYQSDAFDYGNNRFATDTWGDLGYAGFRIHFNLNSPQYKDELIVFLGASYFRALGKGQQYGLSARALAIDTVGGKGEEFPRFSEFWLEKPAADAEYVTVYALLDSPRATGAYRFVITPGEQTVLEVSAQVFLREKSAKSIPTLGLAPLTSMFFFGENQPDPRDYRPEVHDSDGLLIESDSGECIWRPLQNPREPLVTSFSLQGLKGFGLMQRARHFGRFEDPEAHYERRPSAWVEPLGQWGAGRVELVQLPTPDETHDNIVAYWVPEKLPEPDMPLAFSYRLHWQAETQQRPPSSWAVQSRRGIGFTKLSEAQRAAQVQYVIDFMGPALMSLQTDADLKAIVNCDGNGEVLEQHVYFIPATQVWRLVLRIRRLDKTRPVEVRAFLKHQQNTVSETWSYIITPE